MVHAFLQQLRTKLENESAEEMKQMVTMKNNE